MFERQSARGIPVHKLDSPTVRYPLLFTFSTSRTETMGFPSEPPWCDKLTWTSFTSSLSYLDFTSQPSCCHPRRALPNTHREVPGYVSGACDSLERIIHTDGLISLMAASCAKYGAVARMLLEMGSHQTI